jgi:hypothetical protein
MTDQPTLSERAEARAAAKRRRKKNLERRETCFDLFLSGISHQQIAKALKVSTATVRRIIDAAVAERRLDAPERFARVQVARLTKALALADLKLEEGDIRAFGPFIRLVAELDRYHGLEAPNIARRLARAEYALTAPPPPLALPCAAAPLEAGPAAPLDLAPVVEIADSGA